MPVAPEIQQMLVDNYNPLPQQVWGNAPMPTRGNITADVGSDNFVGLRRPYFDRHGRPSVTINVGRTTLVKGQQVPIREHRLIKDLINNGVLSPTFNATTLHKEEWDLLDQTVLLAARYRLRAWPDLVAAGSYSGFPGMATLMLEHETTSDPGEAIVDMTGLGQGRNDEPLYQLEGLPLPITHTDFWFDARKLAVSRKGGSPLDVRMGEAAGRRIAESVEKTTIGTNTGITYGGLSTQYGGYGRTSAVYGYTNFPSRLTYTSITRPTTGGWSPATTLAQVLAMRDQLYANKFYGPFMLYTSNDWDQYMDNDYIVTSGAGGVSGLSVQTLRNRLRAIDGISDVRRLDMLFSAAPSTTGGPGGEGFTATSTSPFQLIMVQQTQDVARAVVGMDITTIQWESVGGMRLNFKTLCILVPQLRAEYYGRCGILHGTTA